MKNTFLLLFSLFIFQSSIAAQEVVSSTFLVSYTQEYFTEELQIPFSKNGVDLYRIQYTTTGLGGEPDTASGLVVIPQISEVFSLPLVSYSHGTVGSRYDVPSYLSFEHSLPAIYASMGTVCIAADYLGLGDSKGPHPYVHAASEAWVSHDMLLAVKDYLPNEMNTKLNDQLFITGYSQGGHAAMALHRLIETETSTEVNASFPMSGPYSISTGMKDLLLSDQEYGIVAYLVATAISYQEVYGTIYPNGDINQFFKPEYIDIILKYVNEEEDLFVVNEELVNALILNEGGSFPKKMVFDDIVDAILNDDNHPINIALRDNDVYDWTPKAETNLIYCTADDQVSYTNSLIAVEKMIENGALNVVATDVDTYADHTECVTPAATNFVFYLLLNSDITSTKEISNRNVLLYPNPTSGSFTIGVEGISKGNANISNMQGQVVRSIKLVRELQEVSIDLPQGIYVINVTDQTGQTIAVERLIIH